jgi:hypothetical protein
MPEVDGQDVAALPAIGCIHPALPADGEAPRAVRRQDGGHVS